MDIKDCFNKGLLFKTRSSDSKAKQSLKSAEGSLKKAQGNIKIDNMDVAVINGLYSHVSLIPGIIVFRWYQGAKPRVYA